MQIIFDEKKKLDTNPVFNLFVQGENMAESIRIVGPKMVGALDLSQLRMAVRMTNAAYETMVEQTLEQDVTDDDTITLVWNVDRQFTSKPGHAQVMLVGYGNNEEVIKITSSGIEIKEDETFVSAPQGSTWDQILSEMYELATQTRASQTAAAASATSAAASEQVAISKAEEIKTAAEQTLANAQAAAASAAQAAASAASVDPSTFVKQVNGEVPVGGAVSVTTRNLAYQVGDTITSANGAFDPNTAIGGTWTSQTMRVQDVPPTQIQLGDGVTSAAPNVCSFCVRNSLCIVSMYAITCTTASNLTTNLPAPLFTVYSSTPNGVLLLANPTTLRSGGAIASESFEVVYPVATAQALTIWTKTA